MRKKCSNCVGNDILFCSRKRDRKNKSCKRWIYVKSSCFTCRNIEYCKQLGKETHEDKICWNYKESKIKRKKESLSNKKDEKLKRDEDEEILKEDNIDSELFSPIDLVENIISSDYDQESFKQLDDSAFPKADNPINFILSDRFLNIKLFPKQLKYCLDFWSAYCPYCSDVKYIKNIKVRTRIDNILDRTVLYKNGICPKCKRTRYEAIKRKYHNYYCTFIGVLGQRSGKSALSAIIAATLTHYYLKIPDIGDYFNLLPSVSRIHGTFVGITYGDAFDNLWTPFFNILSNSPWYKSYHAFLDEEGRKIGKEFYKLRDNFVVYTWKNIRVYPSGPDRRKLRGRTRYFWSIDELGWFSGKDDSIKFDPDQIYEALDNSLMTLVPASKKKLKKNPDLLSPAGVGISSPRAKVDKVMRLYKSSLSSRDSYGVKGPTWENNPTIRRKDLARKFSENRIEAERNFGANPPFESNPFINESYVIAPCFSKKPNLFYVNKIVLTKGSMNRTLCYPEIKFLKVHNFPSVLSIDTGYNKNSFCCCLSHFYPKKNSPEEFLIATSGILEVVPEKYAISFPDMYHSVIKPICLNFNVKLVVFDRWQSIDLSQTVYRDLNIETLIYSVRYSDFDDLRFDISASDVMYPRIERNLKELVSLEKDIDSLVKGNPVSHLFLQLLLSKDTGKIVTKGDITTDDILRSVALGMSVLKSKDYEKVFKGDSKDMNKVRVEDMIHVSSISSPIPQINYGNLGYIHNLSSGGVT